MATVMEDLLQKYNLTYDQLSAEERETLNVWLSAINQNTLTLDLVREFIKQMRDGIEQQLTKFDTDGKLDLYLKARLRNLMLLDAFLTSPIKAKQQLEKAVADIAGGVG